MYKLDLKFSLGDSVKLIVKNGYFTKVVNGIIENKLHIDSGREYVIDVDGTKYQVSKEYLSYCNSDESEQKDDYLSVKEYLPRVGKNVLVYHGSYSILHLEVVEGIMVANDNKCLDLSWYPGGKPLVNSTAWMSIPEYNK